MVGVETHQSGTNRPRAEYRRDEQSKKETTRDISFRDGMASIYIMNAGKVATASYCNVAVQLPTCTHCLISNI
jgi:hypothetical protein